MLVLSRKPGEQICIGPDVTLTVVEVRGGRVKIGITATEQVPVQRGEIVEAPTEPPARKPA